MTRPSESAATILDVARLAGVSRTSVSRVLNEPDRVSPDTLQRVRDAAEALRYSPSSAARGLRGGRTGLIALLVGDIAQPFHGALAKAVATAAEARGLGVFLHDLGHRADRLETILRRLPRQQLDGVLIATADPVSSTAVVDAVDECLRNGLAVVTAIKQFEDDRVAAVRSGHDESARLASEALAAAGFTRPALLVGDRDSPISLRLAIGAQDAHVVETGYDFDGAFAATSRLPGTIDSVIAATVPTALGASAGLASADRRLPMVVCEEVPLARQLRPTLTTSAVPPAATGEEMVRLLDHAVRKQSTSPIQLNARLTRRETF